MTSTADTTTTSGTDDTTTDAGTDDQQQQHDDQQHDDTGDAGAARAQRLRQRARAAEQERDQLAARLVGHQRDAVLRAAAEHLARPEDVLELSGVPLQDLLDEDGAVDAGAVRASTTAVVEARGERFARPRPRASFDGGARSTHRPQQSG
jgi:hypothetical protein